MFLDPSHLENTPPSDILAAAAKGHLGLDQRFIRALISRPDESIPAAVEFAQRDLNADPVDLTFELLSMFRYWKTPQAIPFLVKLIREDPESTPDEVTETLVHLGQPALEPLLQLYADLDEEQNGEVAFVLANLRIRDPRILNLLLNRIDFDFEDTLLLLGMYGDPAALPTVEAAAAKLGTLDDASQRSLNELRDQLKSSPDLTPQAEEDEFDIWDLYPDETAPPLEILDDEQRLQALESPVAELRQAAAASFFNQEVDAQRESLLKVAESDPEPSVRASAWQALMLSTEDAGVLEAMLRRLRQTDVPAEELGGLLVGLSSEVDRNEVRTAIERLYEVPEARAKAMEAMWRSMHPSFRDRFAKHLRDSDVEIRRAALWGCGYYGLRTELDKIRAFFDDEILRSDALFAYTLALPGEVSPGRVRSMLTRIEKDARGLSEMEEYLVKTALDEKLMLAGKEPVFANEQD